MVLQSSAWLQTDAILFANIAGSRPLAQIDEFSIKVLRRGVGELNINDPGGAECFADDVLRQTMHLHIPNSSGRSDSGTDAKNVADANQQGRDIRGGKGILHPKDQYSPRGQHSHKFPQVSGRKTPGHMLQNDVAVDE